MRREYTVVNAVQITGKMILIDMRALIRQRFQKPTTVAYKDARQQR